VKNDDLEARIQELERELDALPEPKATWFLEPARSEGARLEAQIAAASGSPVIEAILRSWAGAVAVLNAQRQVLAVNAGYLDLLGVDAPEAVLGLRPGEGVRCVHSQEHVPGGCGTSLACRTCGAAVSILAALREDGPAERSCSFTFLRNGALVDTELRVRAQSIAVQGERLILLSIVDVSLERRRAALERSLFRELADELGAVVAACDEMDGASAAEVTLAAADAREVAARIARELDLQRALMSAIPVGYAAAPVAVPIGGILDGLRALFRHHPLAARKRLRVQGAGDANVVETDPFLLQRLLTHLLLNAFEASPEGAEVALTVEARDGAIAFKVWNPGEIPPAVAPRIFQRYFTTHDDEGRGQGTFVVKHFGERVLRGKVRFTSTRAGGTTFELAIPRSLRAGAPTIAVV
jgi:signal transduction histidine kinase